MSYNTRLVLLPWRLHNIRFLLKTSFLIYWKNKAWQLLSKNGSLGDRWIRCLLRFHHSIFQEMERQRISANRCFYLLLSPFINTCTSNQSSSNNINNNNQIIFFYLTHWGFTPKGTFWRSRDSKSSYYSIRHHIWLL